MPYDACKRAARSRASPFRASRGRRRTVPTVADTTRYEKTEMGAAEISKRRKNLRGRMRTMLILTDPSRTVEELRAQGAQLGVPDDFLETLVREGYLAPVA